MEWRRLGVVERFDIVEQVGLRFGPRAVAGAMRPRILQTAAEALCGRVVAAIPLAVIEQTIPYSVSRA